MKTPRRSRRVLSGDEAWLWGEIAKLITPLRGKAVPKAPQKAPKPTEAPPTRRPPVVGSVIGPAAPKLDLVAAVSLAPQPKRKLKLGAPAANTATPGTTLVRPTGPPAPGLERKERRGLERGSLAIEARIDLHGLYQAEAHAALIGFISRARAAGHARVLVVTGKGSESADFPSERGVLRRSVPHWLRGPELRGLVLGFEEAGRRHGGAGALYVRLKRR